MSNDADIIRTITDKGFVGGDLGTIEDLVSPSFVSHDPPPGFGADRDGLLGVAAEVTRALSDRRMELEELVDTTDGRVVENWTMVARHDEDIFGLPASGQEVRVRGIELWRCEDGRVVEHWGAIDIGDLAEKALAATAVESG